MLFFGVIDLVVGNSICLMERERNNPLSDLRSIVIDRLCSSSKSLSSHIRVLGNITQIEKVFSGSREKQQIGIYFLLKLILTSAMKIARKLAECPPSDSEVPNQR